MLEAEAVLAGGSVLEAIGVLYATQERQQSMQIRDIAEATGLTAHTIRFYEKEGLLPAIPRSAAGVREYQPNHLTWFRFVADLRRTGMSLEAMREFLRDGYGCPSKDIVTQAQAEGSARRRMVILRQHRLSIQERLDEIHRLLDAVDERLASLESCPSLKPTKAKRDAALAST